MDWRMVVIRTLALALDEQHKEHEQAAINKRRRMCGTCQSFGWTGERGGRCGLCGKRVGYGDGTECPNWVPRTCRIDECLAHTLYDSAIPED